MAIPEQFPERSNQDFNKAFYHFLQPRLGLVFQPNTISALVRFYQSIEQVETLSDTYMSDTYDRTGVDQDLNAERWNNEVQRAYLVHRIEVKKALNEEISRSHNLRQKRIIRMPKFKSL